MPSAKRRLKETRKVFMTEWLCFLVQCSSGISSCVVVVKNTESTEETKRVPLELEVCSKRDGFWHCLGLPRSADSYSKSGKTMD